MKERSLEENARKETEKKAQFGANKCGESYGIKRG